ncbi:MAG: hypothetical protein NTX25_23040 [Proteobacteria bacterium]|nr:hypothetical protein [Pseudomonadota bacterium]
MKKLLLAVLVSGAAFTAHANEAKKTKVEGGSATFKALDKDNDGFISAEEAAANTELTGAWATVDKDGDKKVSVAEFKTFEHAGKKTHK